jgi:DNA-directed RNA polymerase, mitochondrial
MNDLVSRQEELETGMFEECSARYWRDVAKNGTANSRAFWSLVEPYVEQLAEKITTDIQGWYDNKSGIRGVRVWAPALAALPPLDVAVFTVMTLGDMVSGSNCQDVTNRLGDSIQRIHQYAQMDGSRKTDIENLIRGNSSRKAFKRAQMILTILNSAGKWDRNQRMMVGSYLLRAACDTTGLWYTKTESVYIKRVLRKEIVFHWAEQSQEILQALHDAQSRIRPEMPYMLCPPKPWSTAEEGGYLKLRYPLVKGNKLSGKASTFAPRDSVAVAALDAMSATPFRVNEFVLGALDWVYENKAGAGKFVPDQHKHLPQKPHDIETNEDSRKQWRKDRHLIEKEHEAKMERIHTMLHTRRRARQAGREHTAIYIPNQFDFRSRIYPAGSQFLHPQSNDLVKSLLRFNETIPLGEGGMDWLLRNAASLAGHDKLSYEDRETWAHDNLEKITKVGLDPAGMLDWWADPDIIEDPWRFIAISREITMALRSGRVSEFPSTAICSVDGVTNALQHYAALGLDPVAAEATGLVPSDRPSDMYTRVLNKVIPKVELVATGQHICEPTEVVEKLLANFMRKMLRFQQEMAGIAEHYRKHQAAGRQQLSSWYNAETDDIRKAYEVSDSEKPLQEMMSARYWLDRLRINGRKIVKRNAMTYAYGLTEYGAKDQLVEFVDKGHKFFQFQHSQWLGKLVYSTIPEVVESARVYMDWIQECARAVATEGKDLEWTTPTGVHVSQRYFRYEPKSLATPVGQFRYYLIDDPDSPAKRDNRKSVTASTPNVIHSFDASHMQMTVVAGKKEGLNSWAMVHDSYGTHAARMGQLNSILREQFIELYQPDRLVQWKESVEKNTGVTLPSPPPRGKFDLNHVRQSRYFFH